MKGPLPLPTSITAGGSMPSSFLMPSHHSFSYSGSAQPCTVTLPPPYHKSGSIGYFGMDKFVTVPQPLDSLDSLSITKFKRGSLQTRCTVFTPTRLICLIPPLPSFQIMLQVRLFLR